MDATWEKIYELYSDQDRALLLKAYNYAKEAPVSYTHLTLPTNSRV